MNKLGNRLRTIGEQLRKCTEKVPIIPGTPLDFAWKLYKQLYIPRKPDLQEGLIAHYIGTSMWDGLWNEFGQAEKSSKNAVFQYTLTAIGYKDWPKKKRDRRDFA